MRAILVASCLMLTLTSHQTSADPYSIALAKYVAGHDDAASDDLLRAEPGWAIALAHVQQADIQSAIDTSAVAARSSGGSILGDSALMFPVRRRLEAMAMLHTEYALFGELNPKDAGFQIAMAHRALTISRSLVEPFRFQTSLVEGAEIRRAREFLPHWYALAASALLWHYADQNALSLIDEGLKLFPGDRDLLFWRGRVLEFHAVWVGTPATDPTPAVRTMQKRDPHGFDRLTNARVWGPVEEAYRRVIQLDPDNAAVHLHLGYALHSQRRYADAKTEYEFARDRSTDSFVVYVADLLLARLEEDQNNLKDAVPHYERAIAKMPGAQSAYVGLGSVEVRLGDAQRARELAEQLAAIPEQQRVHDPWWAFRTTRVPGDDLQWLRAAVRQ
jgi:tetratricopeptide (TPR) repeat protein